MSKRHPLNEVEPPVAMRRGKRPAADPTDRPRRPGRRERAQQRDADRPPRYRTARMTPDHWHPDGDAVVPGELPVDVWGGIPGEPAEVELLHTGRHRIVGRFHAPVGEPHPLRRAPVCEHFDACGGCPLMHLVPAGQERARLALLRDALAEVGLQALTPSSVQPSPEGDEGYRHVVKLVVGRSDHGHLRIGTFARRTHRVVAIPGCNVATPVLRRVMSVVAHTIIELDIWPFDPQTGRGTLRHVVMRQSRSHGEVLVTLVAGGRNRALGILAERLSGAVGEVAGVHLHLNDDPGNAIFARDEEGQVPTVKLVGKDVIEERLGEVTLAIGPGDFYQANPAMAERIAQDLRELLAPDRDRPLLDLYCGVGAFTLALGREHGWALGVEVVGGAVSRARENARRNRIAAEFLAGDTVELLPEVGQRLEGRHPVVMLDPARRGAGEGVLAGVLAMQPARIAYLSCNPRAMARDLVELQAAGWRVRELRAYDMFPQTAHVETLALLDPPEAVGEGLAAPRRRVVR
ncbi:23S rRNA (uracil(1939)-C(5))-methyltransferase RlmD [Myxococcota bacterium]|nr:23S rRNA (uracil(1939)-C(5))-methyltransferase RlmD [Myxococcota bacterium]